MKINKVYAAFYSATGTTAKVAATAATSAALELDCPFEVYDFSRPHVRAVPCSFHEGDLVIVGVPTYAGRIPNLFLPYLKEKFFGNGAVAVPVVTFGNRAFDDSLSELRYVLEENGFHTIAAGAFSCEHSFSTTLGAGRPDAQDLALAMQLGAKAATIVKNAPDVPAEKLASAVKTPVDVPGNSPAGPYYTPRDRQGNGIDIRKVKPKLDLSKCDECGFCVEVCPMAAIPADDISNVTGVCIKCNACVKRCPKGARYFDDEGYLYHKSELEAMYGDRRAESVIF